MVYIYAYRMPWGEVIRIRANLAEASAPIQVEGPEDDGAECWVSTPYQTADARHRDEEMLRLAVKYLGADFYRDPSSDLTDEEQLQAAVDGAVELT